MKLEDETDRAIAKSIELGRRVAEDLLPFETDGSLAWAVESAKQMHERAFARTGRTDNGNPLTGAHVQIDATQHLDHPLIGVKPLAQPLHRNHLTLPRTRIPFLNFLIFTHRSALVTQHCLIRI